MRKHFHKIILLLSLPALLLACVAPAMGAPRTSANYSVITDSADSGGRRASSSSYTNDGSVGMVAGVSSVASPALTVKRGFIAQLTEVTALQLAATPTIIDETATRQLSATQLLDDLTTNPIPSGSITWSVVSGPLASISNDGLATAAAVYQDTPATAQGSYAGTTGTLNLTILNTLQDNFGAYANDGIDDDWQVQYFGQPPNANAGPLLDPDGDGQNNLFEFTAGLVPTNSLSRFRVTIAPVPGQPTQKNITFDPIVAGRTYTVKASPELNPASWSDLTGSTTSNDGNERTVTDTAADSPMKFYRVEITRP